MGPSADDLNTYILFRKMGRGIREIIGPIFGNEIEVAKQKFFAPDVKIHVLHEQTFASWYSAHYKEHVKQFWMDKLFCYFVLNLEWIGPVKLFVMERGFSSDWFTLSEVYDNGEKYLLLNPIVTANPFYVPRLMLEIQKQCGLKVIGGYDYYVASTGKTFTGHRALQRSLGEQLLKTISKN